MFKCSICLGPGPFCVCHQQIWRLLACVQVAWCHRCHYVQEFATRVSPCPAFAMAAPEMVQLLKWHGVGGSTEPSQRFLLGSVVTIAHISEGFRKIYALFGVLFTGLNNVAVYKYEVCMGDGWFKLITWKNGMQGLMRRIRPPINRQDAYNGEPRTRKHVRNISSSMPWRSTWDIARPSAINCFVWGNWPSLTWGGFHQLVWQNRCKALIAFK